MKKYAVDGWSMEFPENWLTERDEADGHLLFYPPDSPLTVHVSPFHLEREGAPAPAEMVSRVFRVSLAHQGGRDLRPVLWEGPLPEGFVGETFEDEAVENGQRLCRLCLGVYGPGELLSVNVYGDTWTECREAMDYFKTLERM